MPRVQLYVKVTFEATWEAFQKTCIREGSTPSRHMEKWVADYMAVHAQGNPQTLLDHAGKPQTLPLWKTCRHGSEGLQGGSFVCRQDGILRSQTICEMRNGNSRCYRPPEVQK